MGEKAQTGKAPEERTQDPELKRPLDPKRVLQILEFRRKALDFVESMLESEITMDELRLGEAIICERDYESIVQERYILKLCGYPLCSNQITKEWKQRYHISLKDRKIYDTESRKLYCSVKCMNSSTKYQSEKVPKHPIWMRPEEVKLDFSFGTPTSNL